MGRVIELTLAGCLLVSAGCRDSRSGTSADRETPGTNAQVFQVRGVITAVKPQSKELEIKHEAIPGYMPAMTMPFDVRDPGVSAPVKAGDVVTFRLIVTQTQ